MVGLDPTISETNPRVTRFSGLSGAQPENDAANFMAPPS